MSAPNSFTLALRAAELRVAVVPGEVAPIRLKSRALEPRQSVLDTLDGEEAFALGMALIRASMKVQP